MTKIAVTPEEVKENMQDVIVRTAQEFDKPVTYVTVRMKNGFTLRESTTCVDPANYSEKIGKDICLEKIEDKVWFLLGYALQDKVHNEPTDFMDRLLKEKDELTGRLRKLEKALETPDFEKKVGETQIKLLYKQVEFMSGYLDVLTNRISDLNGK